MNRSTKFLSFFFSLFIYLQNYNKKNGKGEEYDSIVLIEVATEITTEVPTEIITELSGTTRKYEDTELQK